MGEYVISRDRFGPTFGPAATVTRWWVFLAAGIAAVVVGGILLFSPDIAVGTLALLVALGLVFTGISELTGAGRYRTAWTTVAGAALVVAGALTVVWPGITLWAVAVVAGVGLLVSGATRLVAAVMDHPEGWAWLAIGGGLSALIGVLALAWPGATIVVLALLLGFRTLLFGAAEIAFALALREAQQGT